MTAGAQLQRHAAGNHRVPHTHYSARSPPFPAATCAASVLVPLLGWSGGPSIRPVLNLTAAAAAATAPCAARRTAQDLESRQSQQSAALEFQYKQEYEAFTAHWDGLTSGLKAKIESQQNALRRKHEKEMQDFQVIINRRTVC